MQDPADRHLPKQRSLRVQHFHPQHLRGNKERDFSPRTNRVASERIHLAERNGRRQPPPASSIKPLPAQTTSRQTVCGCALRSDARTGQHAAREVQVEDREQGRRHETAAAAEDQRLRQSDQERARAHELPNEEVRQLGYGAEDKNPQPRSGDLLQRR